jgi:hypothetical protein
VFDSYRLLSENEGIPHAVDTGSGTLMKLEYIV